jgi:hypothetical protein
MQGKSTLAYAYANTCYTSQAEDDNLKRVVTTCKSLVGKKWYQKMVQKMVPDVVLYIPHQLQPLLAQGQGQAG